MTSRAPKGEGILNQLYGSDNFHRGGVGRVGLQPLTEQSSESALIDRASVEGAVVLQIGTDYVTFKSGVKIRIVYSPRTEPPAPAS